MSVDELVKFEPFGVGIEELAVIYPGNDAWVQIQNNLDLPPAAISVFGNAQIDTDQSKFGGSSLWLPNDVLLLHCDGADGSTVFTDACAHPMTTYGNAQIDTAQSQFGGASMLLDGSLDFIDTPNHPDFNFTGDFTIDFWMRPVDVATASGWIMGKYGTGGNGYAPFALLQFHNIVAVYATTADGSWSMFSGVTIANGLVANAWQHIALVRSGNTWYGFTNGVQTWTATNAGVLWNNALALKIGADTGGGAGFNGWLDEIRMTKSARWTANFTPPIAPSPNQSFVNVPSSPDFDFGSGDFTIDFWVRFDSLNEGVWLVIKGVYQNTPLALYHQGGTIYLYATTTLGAWDLFDTASVASGFVIRTWYHLALVRAGGVWSFYVNGVYTAGANKPGTLMVTTYPFQIGSYGLGQAGFNGWIDEFRVSKGIARWTAPFSYPQAVLADSPRVYLRLGEASGGFADSSGRNHPGTATGGVTYGLAGAISDGNTAVTLNGTTGYVTVPDHADLDLGDVWTLECWVKTTAYTTTLQGLISKGANGYLMRLNRIGGHLYLNLLRELAADMCTATAMLPEDGQWHHLAATKNGTTIKLYQDGVDVTGTINNQTCTDTTTELRIGTSSTSTPGEPLNGSIDEVAVYATDLSAARILAHYQVRTGTGLPAAAYTPDIYTKLLIHADGADGSTVLDPPNPAWVQIQGYMGGGPGANPAWMEVER